MLADWKPYQAMWAKGHEAHVGRILWKHGLKDSDNAMN